MSSSSSDGPIVAVPPPWTLKGTVYSFMLYTTAKGVSELAANKKFMYAPLERESSFASGKFIGGLGMVQVIRYKGSPVGPYDELLIVPGFFSYSEAKGESVNKKKHSRVTRIYVSQKQTCWNGRKNWNIPKHLARFTFTELPGNGVSIAVYPYEDDGQSPSALKSGSTPFFSATYTPISYIPALPMSTAIAKYVGVDVSLAQPPLPQGGVEAEELPGTEHWRRIVPYQFSNKTTLGWWDLKQSSNPTEEDTLLANEARGRAEEEGYVNFWPGIGRRRIGAKMEDATIVFPEATECDEPVLTISS